MRTFMRRFTVLASMVFCIGLSLPAAAAPVMDSYSTGPGQGGPDNLDDVWQAVFDAWGLDPDGDDDRDGNTNAVESVASTNPRNASDSLKVGNMVLTPSTVTFYFTQKAGKKYRVVSDTSVTGAFSGSENITAIGGVVLGVSQADHRSTSDANSQSLTVARVGATKFYKLEVSDLDSDSDGVSTWAEGLMGLDPIKADTDDDGILDGTLANAEVSVPDVISIISTNTLAQEDGQQPGLFTISRTRSLLPVTVNLSVAGTAAPGGGGGAGGGSGGDYTLSSGTILNFGSGEKSKQLYVNPASDTEVEGSESVTATLASATAGSYAAPVIDPKHATATVIIANATNPTGTGLTARYYDHSSSTANNALNFGDAGNYSYTRSGTTPNFTGSVVVTPTGLTTQRLVDVLAAVQVGGEVKLSFTGGGNLNTATYNHFNYVVASKNASSFTCTLPPGAGLPASSSSTCNFSIQPVHPAVVERIDPTVGNDWIYGTPNGVTIAAAAGTTATNVSDNYSETFDMYLSPATAGSYRFQLDADDKARVLLDLDRNGTFELPGEQIIEHGWDSAATVGTFKISSSYNLVVPASAAERYRMRVEHVETVDAARCRLQWSRDGGAFANIPQAEQFTHTQAATYAFTRGTPVTTGTATIALTGHGLSVGNSVTLAFREGTLFTPNTVDVNGYSGTYTVATVPDANTFTVTINSTGATLPGNQGSNTACLLENRSASGTTGVYNKIYTNTTFTGAPGRIGVDGAVTTGNNGIWGTGTPDVALINPETFSARWTGQVQPQFTEEYTFVVHADEGVTLRINGQVQELKTHVATSTGTGTYTYDPVTGNTVVTYTNMAIKPGSFIVGETVRLDPTSGNLNYGGTATYSYDAGTGDMVVTYSAMTNFSAGGHLVGQTVFLDPTSGSLASLATLPYTITAATSTTFTVPVGANLFATGTGNINFLDTFDLQISAVTSNSFTVNHGIGKHPSSTGNANIEIVNKPLKDWAGMGNERYVRIPVVGGTRYDIQLDYWENTSYARCQLYWYSPSQPKQIIPTERLYPVSVPQAPPAHLGEIQATGLVGGAFSYAVLGSNGGTVSVTGLPAWLSYSGGVISGTPPPGSAGSYQFTITITGPNGTSTSVLNLEVEDTGATVDRELWTGVGGTSIPSIPLTTTPNSTSGLSTLAAPTSVNDNFGARIRGYITAPVTGNYYFWLSASDSAEFWLSNDEEVVNSFKRATVTGGGTTPLNWVTAVKSPWMALEQGKRYYFEVLHKSASGADHLAVGWSKPGEATNVPSEVVPGYVLSPYEAPSLASMPGTLYVATLLRQNGAIDPPGGTLKGVGTATMRLSADETVAYITVKYSGLSGMVDGAVAGQPVAADGSSGVNGVIDPTDWHVHSDPYLDHQSYIIYDGTEPPAGDGPKFDSAGNFLYHKWTLAPAGTLSLNDVRELIKQGKAYINLHTALNPGGEIRGNYTLANGSRTFTPPPAPPSWTDDSNTDVGAARFLAQASFGPSVADITALKNLVPSGGKTRYEMWIEDQFSKPATNSLDEVLRTRRADAQGGSAYDETLFFNSWWRNSISGQDQLRQRVAFALSQVHVISGQGPLDNRGEAIAYFYDKLAEGAFGNFREILETTTLTPAMGRYLDMRNNDKPDPTLGRIPNENYAREIKQLFSIGLYRMWPDGTLILNSNDHPIDTYTQREIVGFSHVFTGWTDGYDGADRTGINAPANWMRLMREVPARHYTGPKRVLNNEVMPGIPSLGGVPLDPIAVHNTTHWNQTEYKELPDKELEQSHDQLFNHPNCGPFLCRQLIQRMVTSHPSRDYLYRVVQKFNDNGAGVRGDMQAVIKAILLDYEARSADMVSKPAYGKQREPLLRVAAAGRAFRPGTYGGTYSQSGTRTITVDTSAPHKLASGNNVMLEFTPSSADVTNGIPAPMTAAYSVTVVDADTFTVQATGWATGSYSIPANSTTCTVTMTNHWLQSGNQVYMDFTSGTANGTGIDGQVYTISHSSTANNGDNGSSFTITVSTTDAAVRSGNCMIPRFSPGSMTIAGSGLAAPNDRRVTMRTDQDHHLKVGDQVQLNVYGTQATPAPIDVVATVEAVPDLKTYTFLISSATTGYSNSQGNNSVYQFPLVPQPMTRSGTINSRSSTYQVGSTDADLDQSPVNADTVFNYFLPEYRFPGLLASQGITTPEFQLTAETGVIRQANYLYNGVFNSGTTNGFSSFNTGSNAITLDYSTWVTSNASDLGLGAPVNAGVPWTHNQNIDRLIDQLTTLLMAGQMPAQAKQIMRDLVALPIQSISATSPCTVTTVRPHGYTTGQSVCISGVTDGAFSASVNSSSTARVITVTGANTFTLTGVNCTGAPSAGGVANAHASQIIYNQGNSNPSATERRDRIRAILHLILTSPDFTIQR
jgi:uncharacterized protein (DUF1800 family)